MGEQKKELARVALKKQAVAAQEPFRSSAEQLAELQRQYGVEAVDLSRLVIAVSLLDWIPRETALSHAVVPLSTSGDVLTVAMPDPRQERILEELGFVTGKQVEVRVAPRIDIIAFLERAYSALRRGETVVRGPVAEAEGAELPPSSRGQFDEFAGRKHLRLHDDPFAPADVELSASKAEDLLDLSAERGEVASQHLVCVVEDDAAIRKLVVRLLESEGYRTREASTGAEALQVLLGAAQPPDLLVLDAMLPEVHGFEVLRQLRSDARFADLPVVILTAVHKGWRFAEDLRVLSGVHHYLEKPFEAAQLLAAVDELLGKRQPSELGDAVRDCLQEGIAAIARGDYATAEQSLARGLESEPLAHQLHFQVGVCYGKQGRAFDAIAAFERAVGIAPRYFAGVKNLAVLYQRTGFQNKSTELWERALALAPDATTRESIREHLRRML